jgi:hypothetical protein
VWSDNDDGVGNLRDIRSKSNVLLQHVLHLLPGAFSYRSKRGICLGRYDRKSGNVTAIRIRGGSGLGDAIYQRPIAEYFLATGAEVEVCCAWPEVFTGTNVHVSPFRRDNIDVLAHYVLGKHRPDTNQWQDVCASARVNVPLAFEWTVQNTALVKHWIAAAEGRPLILVHGGRTPMARTDGFGAELLPERAAFVKTLQALKGCYLLRVGKGDNLYDLPVDHDLTGQTSVTDLFDLASVAAGVVAQVSWAVPMAEAFDKPLLCVWSQSGLSPCRDRYISSITPQKVLSKQSSRFVMDDWPADKITGVVNEFRKRG